MAVDGAGNTFFADDKHYKIRRVDAATGIVSTYAGSGEKCARAADPCGETGPATQATFAGIQDVVVDSTGNLYVLDADLSHVSGASGRIRRIDAQSGQILPYAPGTAAAGRPARLGRRSIRHRVRG